ncbi:MAG: alanine racemase [Deltaproteobacteria bacterium]|nr:alanine racemase [Deltaproteobacteria bacterium]
MNQVSCSPSNSCSRPAVVEVDLEALSYNFLSLKRLVNPAKVMAVVKANAYGHGLIECARHLAALGVDAFGVAIVEEGIALRQFGISMPILVCGGVLEEHIRFLLDYDLGITISSIAQLEMVERLAQLVGKGALVHLKVDTGMGRLGIDYRLADELFHIAASCCHCSVQGVYSHFATADAVDLSFSQLQLERFLEVVKFFKNRNVPAPLLHMANSGAAIQMRGSHLDMVRLGLSLYGAHGGAHLRKQIALRPVMSLKARVVLKKSISAGQTVGYGCSWVSRLGTNIAIVPVGYGDGYFRMLSNCGQVLIGGKRCPVVGKVCMDQVMVDVGEMDVREGDEVVIIGGQGEEFIGVEEVAEWAQTIPYEVMTAFDLRLPRRYFGSIT